MLTRVPIGPLLASITLSTAFAAPAAVYAAGVVPEGTAIAASLAGDRQLVLLSPLESAAGVTPGGWRMEKTSVAVADDNAPAKVGRRAITLRGQALGGGSKGDFMVHNGVPGETHVLGLWVQVAEGANVGSVGLQLSDAEGESLMYTTAVDGGGWRWIEVDVTSDAIKQAYPQGDKNGKLDGAIGGVHVVWFAENTGPSAITIDGLMATRRASGGAGDTLNVSLEAPDEAVAGESAAAWLMVTNPSSEPRSIEIDYAVDGDASLHEPPLPDPVLGSNLARGAKSRTEFEGKAIGRENSLTDGELENGDETGWRGKLTEAVQVVELPEPRTITALGYRAGDANWVWLVDVLASADGVNYTPVEGLQNVSLHKKWADQRLGVKTPFQAKFLKLRYHDEGREHEQLRLPAELFLYDGIADEAWELPRGDREVRTGTTTATVAARSFEMVELDLGGSLQPGAYMVSYKLASPTHRQAGYRHVFVAPTGTIAGSPDSPHGVNASTISYAPKHRELGMGWVRFENLKWPFYSPEPGRYDFSGAVGPWHVPLDSYLREYKENGLSVIPFLFLSAKYATTAPDSVPERRRDSYPPDDAKFAEFCFQVAARYGHREHPSDVLLTDDKRSGLGLLEVYEIWNEPNLNDPGWGPWVSDLDRYMQMLRPAVEAIKKADPDAKVSNGGWAGLTVEINEPLVTYKYEDGKRPLDIIDILNVHHYNGREAPEVATINRNIYRSGETGPAALTYYEEMQRLVEWRDEQRPGLPIWMTETGHDTGGPIGINERLQAARLPRGTMLALAAGFDKVFIYREQGSTPSLHAAAGLFRNDGSKKPSWFSYATLIRQLEGAKSPRRLAHADPNVWMFAWDKGGETLVTAWTVAGESPLGVDLGNATVVDAFGAEHTTNLGRDFVLTDMPIYVRGIANGGVVAEMAARFESLAAEKAAAAQRLADMPVYLYDFGTTEHVGTMLLGTMRKYAAVGVDAYDDARGYGFTKPGTQIDDAHWVKDDLSRDGVRTSEGTAFRAKVPAGRYDVRFEITPLGDSVTATMTGIAGGSQAFTCTKSDGGGRHSAQVEATGGVLELGVDDWSVFRSLSLVPVQ